LYLEACSSDFHNIIIILGSALSETVRNSIEEQYLGDFLQDRNHW